MKQIKKTNKKGKVYLVGAGPGDVGLLTLQGATLLEQADVVVYDWLVNPLILDMAPNAQKIYVGKKTIGGKRKCMRQDAINDLLVDLAKKNQTIVRLKGGDPFLFGRGGEEASCLKENKIPFEIVPGVTAGTSVPAYAGIPVTDRRKASLVTFVTAHEDLKKGKGSVDWKKVSDLEGTLVLFMAVKNLEMIFKKMIQFGRSPKTPVCLVQWGTLPDQVAVDGTLATMAQKIKKQKIASPAVVVIGEVTRLRKELNWFSPKKASQKKPLSGKTVLVTHARTQASALSKSLEEQGANVFEFPAIRIEKPKKHKAFDQALKQMTSYDWIVFTSVNAVESVMSRLDRLGLDARHFAKIKIAAIGQATEEALRSRGLIADLMPAQFTSEALIKKLRLAKEIKGNHFFLPRTDIAPEYLNRELKRLGAKVTQEIAYLTRPNTNKGDRQKLEKWLGQGVDYITFTSSSTVQNFFKALPRKKHAKLNSRLVSIGPVTSRELRRHGRKPYRQAKKHTIPGLVEVLCHDK